MKDNEIKKALECCSCETNMYCEEQCPFFEKCINDEPLSKYALDLIKRLQADKEALIAGQETLQKALAEKNEEFKNQSQNFAVLVSDHRALQQSFDNLKGLYEEEKAKVEKTKEKCIGFAKELQTAKAEIVRLRKYDEERDIRLHAKLTETAKAKAIKEFAERLKENTVTVKIGKQTCKVITIEGIDYLVKEMVGDTE